MIINLHYKLGAESAGQARLQDSRFKTVIRIFLALSLPLTASLPAVSCLTQSTWVHFKH